MLPMVSVEFVMGYEVESYTLLCAHIKIGMEAGFIEQLGGTPMTRLRGTLGKVGEHADILEESYTEGFRCWYPRVEDLHADASTVSRCYAEALTVRITFPLYRTAPFVRIPKE